MNRVWMSFALLFLVACTGSTEAPNPVLLVVGFDSAPNATGAEVGLVRDDLSQSQTRLTFLPGSVRTLAAPATAYDVVDRAGARSSLVVLSRSDTPGTGSETGTLTTFRLTGIDPTDPVAFAQTAVAVINDFTPVPPTLQNRTLEFCPKLLQVTQGGDYAAVLHDPSLCGLQLPPFIDVLDLRGSRLLQRLQGVGGTISPSGFYLAQSATDDLLYYATRVAGGLRLQRATLPRPGQSFPPNGEVNLAVTPVEGNVAIPTGQSDALDLQRSGSDIAERLVFLFRDSLRSVTDFSAEAEVSDAVRTANNNARVVRDDRRELQGTFILSVPSANTLTFIPPPDDLSAVSPEATASRRALDATFEPTQSIMYFVGAGEDTPPRPQVSLLPLASFDPGDDLPDLRPVTILQLTNPSFITYAQAVTQTP